MTHGVLMCLDEDEFEGYFLAPYAAYKLYTGNYDAKGWFVTDEFIFQVAGPRSLEVLETATGECLHDIKFARHRMSEIFVVVFFTQQRQNLFHLKPSIRVFI